jgi:hypothetical protein
MVKYIFLNDFLMTKFSNKNMQVLSKKNGALILKSTVLIIPNEI